MSEEHLVKIQEALQQWKTNGKSMKDSYFVDLKKAAKQIYGKSFCLCSARNLIDFWLKKEKNGEIR